MASTSFLTSCQGLGCSDAEIAQDADASFSLDVGQTPEPVPNPLDTSSSKSKHRFQLKKRKVSLETVTFDDETSNFKADFLSGIFDDIAKAQENENPQAPKGSSYRLLNKSSKIRKATVGGTPSHMVVSPAKRASARVTVRQTKDGKGDHASNPEEKGRSSTVCRCQSSVKDVARVGW